MKYKNLRSELYDYYLGDDEKRVKEFAEKCHAILDKKATDGMSALQHKVMQYQVIAEEFSPVIFKNSPFYFETGTLTSLSDGARFAKGYNFVQANGWTHMKNRDKFWNLDKEFLEAKRGQTEEKMYLICGPFNDTSQHFNFNNRPILEGGLKSVYEKAKAKLSDAVTNEQKEFLNSVCDGLLSLKKMAEKFSIAALELSKTETDDELKKNLELIADTASRIPWEKPETLYEALCALAFMRPALGALEGVGPNTFGRLDVDLHPFYKSDIESGILTKDKAYELISKFLIIWDCHYDHDMLMEGYADHELENTYTLGGCDKDGNPLYNEITEMFLRATREENIIFPKIKVRFSENSPKEYLDEINKSVVSGTSAILYQNDDATIPALYRAGRPIEEARDYMIAGCWGVALNQEKFDHGSYVNLLKPFEFALHKLYDKMAKVKLNFKIFDDCKNFEELYNTVVENSRILIEERIRITRIGGQNLSKVDPCPIFSSTLENCIDTMKDYSDNGAKYRDDSLLLFGLPNITDSLLAIKTLVFDRKKYTLEEFLNAVRNNWEGYEEMRMEAIRCHGWGDGSEESCSLANRFNNDLYDICSKIEGSYGGKVHMGHLTYTEIRWWGEKTLATPDGRKNGEYFAQGLTPSRLKKIPSVTDVIRSLSALDSSKMAANSVVNIILPGNKTDLSTCESFLRAVAKTATQSLQLNCTTKEQLLDAQVHPEKYPELIVRVTGFSAKFTSLSKGWQEEVLTRNFYE